MSTPLRWTITPGPERTQVALSGSLDEWADLDALFDQLPPRAALALDLAQVRRISSVGVRVWIVFLEKLKAHDMPVQLHGCSVVIVRQLNMISQFRGHGEVRSAYAPYYCARCNKEQLRLIDLGTDVATQLKQPMACPTCGDPIELDEDPGLYLELQAPPSP